VEKRIRLANESDTQAVIIELDTPGGLAESMRRIVKAIFDSRIPVVVFVSPSGARAASAGVMITLAADIAAMAPGTNIGAAHPVASGGQKIEGTMQDKVTNDMVAYSRSIAKKRGRNADWVEKAVRESVSVTHSEALEANVIDLVADDLTDLIDKIHGREVADKGVLDVKEAVPIVVPQDLRTRILKVVGNPNIAYILMMIGLAGLYFELAHPGVIFPGVIGGICLILAFFAFQTLPVNAAGVLLILLAIVFFVIEMKIVSYGLLSFAGVIALFLGSLMLFSGKPASLKISLSVLVPTLLFVSGFFIVVAGLVFRAQIRRPRTGASGLIGEIGEVREALTPEGKVFVHGELWQAHATIDLPKGSRVRVIDVEGLTLSVAPLD
jgi:membrane-bound serine protease (ClpP class)